MATPNYTFFDVPISSALIPKEGPKALPVPLTFTADQTSITVDLQLTGQLQFISMVQSVFVDNSDNEYPLSLLLSATAQNIIIPPGYQAYLPLPLVKNGSVTVSLVVGLADAIPNTSVFVEFFNVPIPAILWPASDENAPSTTMEVFTDTTATMPTLVFPGGIALKAFILVNTSANPIFYNGDGGSDFATLPAGDSFNSSGAGVYQGPLYLWSTAGGDSYSLTGLI